jgi:nitrite reductase/ring-hydroxylating ferredoxin subunit
VTTHITRVALPPVQELAPGQVRVIPLPRQPGGIPHEALLVRDHDGALHAYLNRCRHLPIPIDSGSRRFLTDDGRELLCRTHGARYRLEDGYCVYGPCAGQSLQPIPIEWDSDDGFLLWQG